MSIRPLTLLRPLAALPRLTAEIMFPPVCLACNAPLASARELTCADCRSAMREVDEWDDRCRQVREILCAGGGVTGFVPLWYFEEGGPVQALVHALKYDGMTAVGREFGRALGARILESGYGGADALVALPLHPSRMRERGFNQADCIARGVSAVTGIPVARRLVRRARFTPSQTALAQGERRANVRGAFRPALRAGRAKGATLLLVDDVVTTGATMGACAAVLRTAGARAVVACAAALAR